MSKLPSEDSDIGKENMQADRQAQYLDRIYKCYKCGKIENGKNLEDLMVNNYPESWLIEYYDNDKEIGSICLLEPQEVKETGTNKVSIHRVYCVACGKLRTRELELLDVEVRKVQAYEKIGIALANMGNALKGVGEQLGEIKYELSKFKNIRG